MFIIIWIFLISLFLRIFNISHYISFHQDQVRDLFYIKNYFEQGKLILLGPKASVGNFFLPPFWYYLMSIAYVFSKSPLAPAVLTAFLSAVTSVVVFLFVKRYFGIRLGFLAAVLFAVSPLAIEYSRFAWNPNPIPLFAILTLFFLYRFIFEKDERSFYWGTVSANLAFQLHYQGLVVLTFFFVYIMFLKKFTLKRFINFVFLNLLLILPFIFYELQNNFKNTSGIINFLIASQSATKLKFLGIPFFIKFIAKDFSEFLSRVLFFKNQTLGYAALFILLSTLAIKTLKLNRQNRYDKPIVLFFILSFIMLFFYKNSLIDFYLLFLIPVVIIYFVLLLNNRFNEKFTLFFTFFIILINLIQSPTFGIFDKTYIWLNESIKKVTVKDDYCIGYDLFPQTFIESKFRYLMSLVKNKPLFEHCQQVLYRCDPNIKFGYYICASAICDKLPATTPLGHLIDMKPLNYDVKIYEFKL